MVVEASKKCICIISRVITVASFELKIYGIGKNQLFTDNTTIWDMFRCFRIHAKLEAAFARYVAGFIELYR